jgi:hypothetical protein
MAHKGKTTSDVTYNLDDGPKVYSNLTVYSRLCEYTAMSHELHGPDYDPRTKDIDRDVLMRVKGGKRHGILGKDGNSLPSVSTVDTQQRLRRRY